ANWTEEDRHAVVTYLRLVKAINHKIPDPDRAVTFDDKESLGNFFGTDGGTVPGKGRSSSPTLSQIAWQNKRHEYAARHQLARRPVRSDGTAGSRRYGRSVARARSTSESRCRTENSAARLFLRSRSASPFRARGAGAGLAQSSQHWRHSRH